MELEIRFVSRLCFRLAEILINYKYNDAANNWGICENGTEAIGCGPQETYRNCADIAVQHGSGIRGPLNHNGID